MTRKMPHTNALRTNDKIDKQKFLDSAPAAREAIATGETDIHRVTIAATADGGADVRIERTHGKGKGKGKGRFVLDPKLANMLSDVLVGGVAGGALQLTDASETAYGDSDEMTMLVRAS